MGFSKYFLSYFTLYFCTYPGFYLLLSLSCFSVRWQKIKSKSNLLNCLVPTPSLFFRRCTDTKKTISNIWSINFGKCTYDQKICSEGVTCPCVTVAVPTTTVPASQNFFFWCTNSSEISAKRLAGWNLKSGIFLLTNHNFFESRNEMFGWYILFTSKYISYISALLPTLFKDKKLLAFHETIRFNLYLYISYVTISWKYVVVVLYIFLRKNLSN